MSRSMLRADRLHRSMGRKAVDQPAIRWATAVAVVFTAGCATAGAVPPVAQASAPATPITTLHPTDSAMRLQDRRGQRVFYLPGEVYEVTVTSLHQGAFLYCYLIADSGTEQFFPNDAQPSARVDGAERVLPGGLPFSLFAGPPGTTETVACFSVVNDLGPLPLGRKTDDNSLASLSRSFESHANQPFELGAFRVVTAR